MLVYFHLVADIRDLTCETALLSDDSLVLNVELQTLILEIVPLLEHNVEPVSECIVNELVL